MCECGGECVGGGVCVRVRKREREREGGEKCVKNPLCVLVFVCE